MRRRLVVIGIISVVVIALAGGVALFVQLRETHKQKEALKPPKPEAPPDLAKLRPTFTAGLDAIHHGEGAEAVKQLSSFSFGNRAVEEYRLYYLATGYQLMNERGRARAILAKLWT